MIHNNVNRSEAETVGAGRQKMPKGIYRQKGSSRYTISFVNSDGIRVRKSTKTTSLAEAKEIRRDWEAAVRSGALVFENKERRKVVPFREFAKTAMLTRSVGKFGGYTEEDLNAFLVNDAVKIRALRDEMAQSKRNGQRPRFKFKSTQTYCTRVKALLAYFGDKDIRKIDSDALSKYVQVRKGDKVSGATINRELCAISNIFGWGSDSKEYRQMRLQNPYRRRLHQQLESEPFVRYWSDTERQEYLKACFGAKGFLAMPKNRIAEISETGWTSGMRIEEILGLKVGQVKFDFDRIELKGFQTKNGKPRNVPFMTERAKEIFKRNCQGKGTDELVFEISGREITYQSFYRVFEKIVGIAKVEEANIHSFRKTAAIDMVVRGRDLASVMTILGHKDFRTTSRYVDMSLVEELRDRAKSVIV